MIRIYRRTEGFPYESVGKCPVCDEKGKYLAVFGDLSPKRSENDKGVVDARSAFRCRLEVVDDNRSAIAFLRDVESGVDWGSVLMFGPAGTGKTTIACKLLFHCIRSRMRCKFTTERVIANAYSASKGGMAAETRSEQWGSSHLAGCQAVDVLCVDEAGPDNSITQKAIDYMVDMLCRFIDRGGKLIVTTNMIPEGDRLDPAYHLRARWGERLWSRLSNAGPIIEVGGRDWRGYRSS